MRRLAAVALAVSALCLAHVVGADTYVVDPGGAGDFTTIQAGVNAAVASIATADTVIVHAGAYPESLDLSIADRPEVIICPSGPSATSILGIRKGGLGSSIWTVMGLTVQGPCSFTEHSHVNWVGCAFRDRYTEDGGLRGPDLLACDFYAPVTLTGYWQTFSALRFHRAPLYLVADGSGDLRMDDCTFEGDPGDTLVRCRSGSEYLWFERCRFVGGAIGIFSDTYAWRVPIIACEFEGLGTAIHAPRLFLAYNEGACLQLDSCRVESCGRLAFMRFDANDPVYQSGGLEIWRSTIVGCTGTAIDVAEEPAAVGAAHVSIFGNRFEHGGGDAVSVAAGNALIRGNVFFDNGGSALSLTLNGGLLVDSVAYNTCALNAGDGISIAYASGSQPPSVAVVRNIAAQNGGEGFHFGSGFDGVVASNDAWQNLGGNYVGVTPDATNLVADPHFCDLAAGDLTVSAGSPCSAYTSTGPIGALGTGCDIELLGAPPPAASAVAFAARPIPARGGVEFALPAIPGVARLDVLDAQGRRIWSAPLERGATSVPWQGEREAGGNAEPGVYWARLSGTGQQRTCRFVWLR